MKKTILLALILGICHTSIYCQNPILFKLDSSYREIIEPKPTEVLDTQLNFTDDRDLFVYFPGGDGATTEKLLLEYINQHLVYPDSAQKAGIEGKLLVQFEIGKTGKISNVEIINGSSPFFDKEVLRLFSSMPDWVWDKKVPMTDRRQVIRMVPITFTLEKDKEKILNK